MVARVALCVLLAGFRGAVGHVDARVFRRVHAAAAQAVFQHLVGARLTGVEMRRPVFVGHPVPGLRRQRFALEMRDQALEFGTGQGGH